MGLRILKPITPGTRHYSVSDFKEITTDTPYKTVAKTKKEIRR